MNDFIKNLNFSLNATIPVFVMDGIWLVFTKNKNT